jgi:hypothetical protein
MRNQRDDGILVRHIRLVVAFHVQLEMYQGL